LLFSAFVITSCSSLVQFFLIKNEIDNRIDFVLLNKKNNIENYLKKYNEIGHFITHDATVSIKENLSICIDTTYYDFVLNSNDRLSKNKILISCLSVKNKNYKIEIRSKVEGTRTFLLDLLIYFISTLIVVGASFIILKYYLLKSIWAPFFDTVKQLKTAKLQKKLEVFDTDISIKEFKDLNVELNEVANNIYQEYQREKIFSEGLNHELMTPLAIIRGKLELMLQSTNLMESDVKLISDIFVTVDRMTKLNKALVLITKLDNDEYIDVDEKNLSKLLDETLNLFEDQFRAKHMTIRKNIIDNVTINMNEMLSYVLLSNLIRNAIIHNKESNGFINISIKNNIISISNSCLDDNVLSDNIFDKFIKKSNSEESLGLGLYIVKKICQIHNIEYSIKKVGYTFTFLLNFDNQSS
jgi:signal transduction histidine kinase